MERYKEYKDSGVQWLGEIPGHWKIQRGKYLFNVINEISITGQEELLTVSDRTGITPRSMKNVTMFMAESLVGYKKCNVGDICSNIMWMWHGAVGVTKFEGVISPSYVVYRQRKNNYVDEYLDMLLRLPRLVKWYAVLSKGLVESRLRLYPDHFLNIRFFFPPLSEQQSIVSYLDTKCAMLDKMLEGKQKQMELLQEMKQRMIADAVTRGLNPDVKMKATGIAWLPEIPEHWEMVRNKTFLILTTEKVGSRKDITLLSLTKQGVIVRDLSEGKGKFPKDFDTYLVVHPNNLVFCLFDVDETPRTVGLVHNDGMLTGAYTNFEVNKSIVTPEFAYYYYLQVDNVKGLRPYYTGLRKVVKTNTFLQIRMPLPPLPEQRAIVSYIQERTAKIDTLTSKLQQEVETIKEYKQRLISDVVTGQIKVC